MGLQANMKVPSLATIRNLFLKWLFFNLITFPALMVFYIPYQLFWIQLTPLQLLKYVFTAGLFAAAVNLVLRPVYAYATRFNDRHFSTVKKHLVVQAPNEKGIFKVTSVSDTEDPPSGLELIGRVMAKLGLEFPTWNWTPEQWDAFEKTAKEMEQK